MNIPSVNQHNTVPACESHTEVDNGYRPLSSKNFVGEMRSRFDIRRTGSVGNMVIGLKIEPKLAAS